MTAKVGLAFVTALPVALVVWGAASALNIANGVALRQQLTPDRLQGRVNVTARMIAAGGQPIGAAIGDLLADNIGTPRSLPHDPGRRHRRDLPVAPPLRHIHTQVITHMRDEADWVG